MSTTKELDKLKKSLTGKELFYTLLEHRPWGLVYRLFRKRSGAVYEGLYPDKVSKHLIASYPHTFTTGVAAKFN